MKQLILVWVFVVSLAGGVQAQEDYISEIKAFQGKLNKEYRDPKESPLSPKDRRRFESHDFFPIDSSYQVKAVFKRSRGLVETIQMETSSGIRAKYDKYGVIEFELNGRMHQLTLYQSHRLRKMEGYEDHLFLPFTDLTSGDQSYGGGRYLDVTIPVGNQMVIDFNKAYNPYCAYSDGYSCPIPPAENNLDTEVLAGIRYVY